jgi:hypothetical protein
MAREIPEVVRAAAGLAATVIDEARRLPETLPGLPVRVIGLAMQQAMKVQQQYAGFVARGDELFTGIRGDDEPGLATFDDDEPAPSGGFRESAFDRAGDTMAPPVTDDEVADLPADPTADAVVAVVDQLAAQVEDGQQSIEELVEESPDTADILDEIAIDELVDQAPTLEETAPGSPALSLAGTEETPVESAADVPTSVDVITPDGEIATVDAAVTDEGIAAVETPADAEADADADADDDTVATTDAAGDTPASDTTASDTGASDTTASDTTASDTGASDTAAADTGAADTGSSETTAGGATATDEGGTPVAAATGAGGNASAPAAAPIDGYDGFSIAQLRGRLRGYALSTVQDLVTYEQSTRSREPYLRMLRNRLEKLEEQAIESSPLAPRGA